MQFRELKQDIVFLWAGSTRPNSPHSPWSMPNAIHKAHPTPPFRAGSPTEHTFPWDSTNSLPEQGYRQAALLSPHSRKEKHQGAAGTLGLGVCTLLSTSPGWDMLDMARCFFTPSSVRKSTFQFRTESQAGLLKISLPFLLYLKGCLMRNGWEN